MTIAQREGTSESAFDALKLRKKMWDGHKTGKVRMESRECDYARVIAFIDHGKHVPWELWGRLFQWLGWAGAGAGAGSGQQEQWRIIWFAADHPRMFPSFGEPLAAEHLNGGYTMPCSHKAVVVYRFEEATRVLIHELLHASCLDPHNETIQIKEATIESWAELFLTALLSHGVPKRAAKLWRKQAQWVRDVNSRAGRHHSVSDPDAYGWRYTVGREAVFESLGIKIPTKPSSTLAGSSRFTIIE